MSATPAGVTRRQAAEPAGRANISQKFSCWAAEPPISTTAQLVPVPPVNDVWTIPGEEHLLAAFQAEDRARFTQIDAGTHYHALQIQDFLRAIREGRPPLVTGEDGRAVVELFTAIYRSNREGRPVLLGNRLMNEEERGPIKAET